MTLEDKCTLRRRFDSWSLECTLRRRFDSWSAPFDAVSTAGVHPSTPFRQLECTLRRRFDSWSAPFDAVSTAGVHPSTPFQPGVMPAKSHAQPGVMPARSHARIKLRKVQGTENPASRRPLTSDPSPTSASRPLTRAAATQTTQFGLFVPQRLRKRWVGPCPLTSVPRRSREALRSVLGAHDRAHRSVLGRSRAPSN